MRAIARLLPLIAARRGLFLEAIGWSAVTQVAVLGLALGLAWVVGRAVAGLPSPLVAVGLVLGGLAVAASLTAWREAWVSHDLAYRLIAILRGRVFDALRRSLPYRSRHRRTGDLTSAVVADIETLEWLYAHTAAQATSALLVLLTCAGVSVAIDPMLLLVWLPLLVLWVMLPRITARRAGRDGDRLARGAAALRSELLDTIRGLRELAGAGMLERQLDRLAADTRAHSRIQVREASRLGAERGLADVALAAAALGAILIVLVDGADVAPALIPLAVTASVAGLGPAAQIADLLRNAGTLRAAAQRIFEILEHPAAVEPADGASPPQRVGEAGLTFDDVGFAYDGERPVLDGLSLRVRPGEIVALVGASGAGKTTAARLATRLWDPDSGSIRLDGIDLRAIPDADLRRRIAVVPQASPLLRGTIRTNITLGDPDATASSIQAAALAAGLLEPAAGLPDGLETAIGEHGAGLSGGQRARVAIARALLVDPRVLVLDEPTASLDPGADAVLLELLRGSPDRAILLVAHRPATIAAADRVVRLGQGGSVH